MKCFLKHPIIYQYQHNYDDINIHMTRTALHFPLTRASPVIGFNMPTGACVSGSKIKPAWCRFEKCWGFFAEKEKSSDPVSYRSLFQPRCFYIFMLLHKAEFRQIDVALVASVINISSPFISTGTTPQWKAIQKSDWSWKVHPWSLNMEFWREVPGKGDSF